jgi:NADH-quinone oxidoreductase F subunit
VHAELAEKVRQVAGRYPRKESALLPALYLAQKHAGHVSKEDLLGIADILDISRSKAFGVRTYYTMFHGTRPGKYHLQVDTNIPAKLMGADDILSHLSRALGVGVGETTPDGLFTLSSVECLGSCGTCPVVQVNDRYYESMTAEKVDQLLAALRQGVMPDWPVKGHFHTACNILLKRRGKYAVDLKSYVEDGGYQALPKALAMAPQDVVKLVRDAGVRGRGGAGFPAGMKWGFLPKDHGKPVYLICNADEGEPGTFKDRQVMEFDPHLLLEGMAISGHAIGSRMGYIYIRGEFAWIADILDRAIEEARAAGKLGTGICGTAVVFDVVVHRGAGAYVCGEETALIESLEGKRGNPRLKPPFPAVVGLYGCPTIVNNVETLACVPAIVTHGAEAFKALGTPNNAGPKLFGVSGHVNRPGVYEFPLGVPLAKVLEQAGGVQGKLKAVVVGGLSVPILTAQEAEGLCLDYDGCMKKGTALGSGGIMVMNDTTRIPEIALRTMRFYAHESCGQCTPCRQGSHVVERLLETLVEGHGTKETIDQVLGLCRTIKGSTLCPTGEAFSVPINAMVTKFRAEFEALVPGEGSPS